jgi:rfaE bifunctional protein kinase chain/domain
MTRSKHAERLVRLIESFSKVTVTVVGDLVADEFVYGEIARVSREAPVLILTHRERLLVPGGAGNAIYNLADLGASVLPVGVVGDDEAGRTLLQRFRQKKIPVSGIIKMKGYTTPTKTRILAGHTHSSRQQVVRIDREPGPQEFQVAQLARFGRECAKASDALLVSDYGYGAATPQILSAIRATKVLENIPVTLDSRYRMLEFSGITAATPNEPEVEEALGVPVRDSEQILDAAGEQLMRRMRLEALVITRGRDGMVAFRRKHRPTSIPSYGSDQVADVTGAGDTVIAAFTAALAAGAEPEDAAHLANYAGGIVVMKRGTATVSAAELTAAVERDLARH